MNLLDRAWPLGSEWRHVLGIFPWYMNAKLWCSRRFQHQTSMRVRELAVPICVVSNKILISHYEQAHI